MSALRWVSWFLTAAMALHAEFPGAIAIRDARVVTVSGPVLQRGTVLIRNGLIEGAGAGIAIPSDAWVIDGTGLTVYPGLIDALGPTGIVSAPAPPPGPAASARGAGAAARPADVPLTKGPEDRPSNNSWIRAADLIDPGDTRISAARNAGFTSAVAVPGGSIFSGEAAFLNLAGSRKSRMVVAAPVAQYVTMDRRGYAGEFPASLLGSIAYVRQVILDAGNYKLEKAAWDRHAAGARRPDYDRALEGFLECPRVLLPARSAVEIERMIRFAAELKTPAVIYGAPEAYGAVEFIARTKVPVLLSLNWPARARDSDPDAPVSLRTLELWDRAPSSAAELAKAGARFAFYLDGTALRDLPKAVKRALDAGLSRADAVRAFTLSAAEIYGLDDRLGSIEKGKMANLIVTDGELFQEGTRLKYIFVAGAKYEPDPPEPPAPAARGGAE